MKNTSNQISKTVSGLSLQPMATLCVLWWSIWMAWAMRMSWTLIFQREFRWFMNSMTIWMFCVITILVMQMPSKPRWKLSPTREKPNRSFLDSNQYLFWFIFSAFWTNSRQARLFLISGCLIFICIFGDRFGWVDQTAGMQKNWEWKWERAGNKKSTAFTVLNFQNGGLCRNRTNDTRIFSPLLYLLS